jgi:hypothetical protein
MHQLSLKSVIITTIKTDRSKPLRSGMFFISPGVAENVLLGYSDDDPEVIKVGKYL